MADRITFTGPAAISRLMSRFSLLGKAGADYERFDNLEKAGFLVERDGDMLYNMFERQGAHHIDVGASRMIVDGQVQFSFLGACSIFSSKEHLNRADMRTVTRSKSNPIRSLLPMVKII
jgi:hypothetical protein